MVGTHTVKAFDEELNRINSRIAEMGGLVEAQLADVIKALVNRDNDLAARVIAQDRRIDDLEIEVNVLAVQLLALRQPVADDLRVAISALKISTDLERIGDHAVNVAKQALVLVQSSPSYSVPTIARMGRLVQGMIKVVLDAFIARNPRTALEVRNQDREVDQIHTSLFRELLTYMMENPRNITPCTHLLFIAKNIERMGDHATNIAESVLFLVHGQAPTDRRPTADNSPVVVVAPSENNDGGGQ